MKGGISVRQKRKWRMSLVMILMTFCLGLSTISSQVVLADPVNQQGTSVNNKDSDGEKRDDFSSQSNAHEDKAKKDEDEKVKAGQWLNQAMKNDNKWVQFCDLFTWIGHNIGWGIVRIVYTISQGAENLIDSIFTLGGLLNNPDVTNITNKVKWLSFVVMGLVLLFLFFKWMTGKAVDMKNVFIQMILGTCLIFASTNFVISGLNVSGGHDLYSWAFNLSKQNYKSFKNDSYFSSSELSKDATESNKKGESNSFSFNAIKANTMDLQYVLSKGNATDLEPSKGGKFKSTGVNDLTPSDFRVLDMSQLLEKPEKASSSDPKNKEIGKYLTYRVDKNEKGQYEGKEISNFLKFFPQGYFRFGFHFSRIIITLLVMTVAFVLAAFNIGSTILELVFLKILSPITIASDIETGKRMKQILMDIWQAWLTITLTGFSLSLFTRIFSFISGLDLNILAYTIALLVSAKVCYDGSNMIKKYFGVDVGVQSGWKTLMGVSSVAHMVHDGASAVSSGVHAVGAGIGSLKDKLSGDANDHGQALDHEDEKSRHASKKSSGEEALDREDGFDLHDFDGGEVVPQAENPVDNDTDSPVDSMDGTSTTPSNEEDQSEWLDEAPETASDMTGDFDSDDTDGDDLETDPMMNGATEEIDDQDQDNDAVSATADMDAGMIDQSSFDEDMDMEDNPMNVTQADDDFDNDSIQAENQASDYMDQSVVDQSQFNQDMDESLVENPHEVNESAETTDGTETPSIQQVMNDEMDPQSMGMTEHPSDDMGNFDTSHSTESMSMDAHSNPEVTDIPSDSSQSMNIGTHDMASDNSSSLSSMAMDKAKSMDQIFSSENMDQYIHQPYHPTHRHASSGHVGTADNPNLEDKK